MVDHTEAILGWCAGIVDGEGSITVHTQKPRKAGNAPWFGLRLTVKMVHWPTIQRLEATFGVGTLKSERRKGKRTLLRWVVSGKEAASVLSLLFRYLHTKQDEAAVAIQFAQANSRRSFGPKNGVPESTTALRRQLMTELAELKQRDYEAHHGQTQS